MRDRTWIVVALIWVCIAIVQELIIHQQHEEIWRLEHKPVYHQRGCPHE